MSRSFELPPPTEEARAHSGRVAAHIRAVIAAAGGWIDFARFMDLALYAPGLGYYSAGAAKFGPPGDFVTAPEISPLFARCLARSCAPYLSGDDRRVVLEIGAGSGALAAALIESLGRAGLDRFCYQVLEVSADLRERQRKCLQASVPGAMSRVRWLDALPSEPLDAIVIANEVADALPVTRFTVAEGGLQEQGVVGAGDGFAWAPRPAGERLTGAVGRLTSGLGRELPAGYTSELSLRLSGWIAALGASLRAGMLLVCDYGASRREYYHPERSDGTLICHYRHRAHADPFVLPGLQDITAWVDFSALAEAAVQCGLAVSGYATQAHFLIDAGIDQELAAGSGAAPDPVLVLQARRLLMPGEMGERFKVMALSRGELSIPGFGFRDLRHLL